MIGAIVGDIVGSRFEWRNCKSKDFELFSEGCAFTDDTVMTLAVCDALLYCNGDFSKLGEQTVRSMRAIGRRYLDCGYGETFLRWLENPNPRPYRSWGNGAAMRVSGCAYVGKTLDQVTELSRTVTEVTHNHPEGIKGAEAVAVATFLARSGTSKSSIQEHICQYYYPIDFSLDDIRAEYCFDVSCQGSVPQALQAFFEADSFEDAIRNAVSIGGDSDTIASIAGSVAGAYYDVPTNIRQQALEFLDSRLLKILEVFEQRYL